MEWIALHIEAIRFIMMSDKSKCRQYYKGCPDQAPEIIYYKKSEVVWINVKQLNMQCEKMLHFDCHRLNFS